MTGPRSGSSGDRRAASLRHAERAERGDVAYLEILEVSSEFGRMSAYISISKRQSRTLLNKQRLPIEARCGDAF